MIVLSGLPFLFRFLPVFLVIYYICPVRYRNAALFLGSVFFYATGEPLFLLLLLGALSGCGSSAPTADEMGHSDYSYVTEDSAAGSNRFGSSAEKHPVQMPMEEPSMPMPAPETESFDSAMAQAQNQNTKLIYRRESRCNA